MTGYAVEFHIPTEHFMSSLTKVSSTTRARHRAWIRRHARGVWRSAIEAGAYRTERFVALAMVQWPGPSIYPTMSRAETLKSEEPGELKGGGEEIGSTEPFLPPGCKREQRFVVPALGERAMPLEWNQQAHSEALESFSDVGR